MRGFALAHDKHGSTVVARLEDGVLKLTLLKRRGSLNRQVVIE